MCHALEYNRDWGYSSGIDTTTPAPRVEVNGEVQGTTSDMDKPVLQKYLISGGYASYQSKFVRRAALRSLSSRSNDAR